MDDNLSLLDWIKRIKDPDPTTFEDAYFGPRPSGNDVVPKLTEELQSSSDGYTRGKFCELLGEMADDSVIPVLEDEIAHPERETTRWAVNAIELIRSPRLRAEAEFFRRHC